MRTRKFFRLTASISFLIAVLLLASGTFSYYVSVSEVRQNTFENNIEILRQTEFLVATALGVIVRNAYSAAIHQDVVSAINKDWDAPDFTPQMQRIATLLNKQAMSSYYIHSMCLYSRYNDAIITDAGQVPLPYFPDRDTVEAFYLSEEISQWVRTEGNYSSLHGQKPVIGFMIRVPIELKESAGVMVVNVDEGLLFQTVLAVNQRFLGDIYILDDEGVILSHSDKTMLASRFMGIELPTPAEQSTGYLVNGSGDTAQFVSFLTSRYTGWRYLAIKNYHQVIGKNRKLMLINIGIALFFIIIGSIVALVLSREYYRPIGEIVKQIGGIQTEGLTTETSGNDFQYIHDSIEIISEKFQQNKVLLKEHFLIDLLLGRQGDSSTIGKQLRYFEIDFTLTNFVIAVMRINDKAAVEQGQAQDHLYAIEERTQAILNLYSSGIVINRGWHELVLIMNFHDDRIDAPHVAGRIAAELSDRLNETCDASVSIGIGGFCRNIGEISRSYREAYDALRSEGIAGTGGIIHITDIRNRNFPHEAMAFIDMEKKKLIEYLRDERYEEADRMIEPLVTQILKKGVLGAPYGKLKLFSLAGEMITEIMRGHAHSDRQADEDLDPLASFRRLQTPEQYIEWLHALIGRKQTEQDNASKRGIDEVVSSVEQYMREHYAVIVDLNEIADLAGFNINYLGRVFKEKTGKTLFEYLSDLRIGAACRLLTSTDKSITEIAESTGYTNKRNMARAFNRSYGMSPTAWRTEHTVQRLKSG